MNVSDKGGSTKKRGINERRKVLSTKGDFRPLKINKYNLSPNL